MANRERNTVMTADENKTLVSRWYGTHLPGKLEEG
jgi:hypothetical protein